MLFKRVDADERKGKNNIQWVDYLGEILLTYNSKMIHSAHEMTPNEAHKKENHLKVKLKLEINRVKTRKYPTLRVGDEVKLYRHHRKGTHFKLEQCQIYSHWDFSKKLGQNYYSLEGQKRQYLRYEMLKV